MRSITTSYVVAGIPELELDRIRSAGQDDFGNPLIASTVRTGDAGAPLRCCLTEAAAGERIALIAFRPPGGRGGYAEVGPVFIHADRCAGYSTPDRFPPAYARRSFVLRGYDVEGRICDALISAGAGADAVIDHLLSRNDVTSVEARNLFYGCFACSAQPLT